MVKGKRPNYLLHLILTVLTLALWGVFVWLPLSIFIHEKRMVIQVDQDGYAPRLASTGQAMNTTDQAAA